MADLRKFFEEAEQKKRAVDVELMKNQIAELNKYHCRKVKIELLKSGPSNIRALEDTREVTGVLMEIDKEVRSCTLDYANPKNLKTFPISYVVSIERT